MIVALSMVIYNEKMNSAKSYLKHVLRKLLKKKGGANSILTSKDTWSSRHPWIMFLLGAVITAAIAFPFQWYLDETQINADLLAANDEIITNATALKETIYPDITSLKAQPVSTADKENNIELMSNIIRLSTNTYYTLDTTFFQLPWFLKSKSLNSLTSGVDSLYSNYTLINSNIDTLNALIQKGNYDPRFFEKVQISTVQAININAVIFYQVQKGIMQYTASWGWFYYLLHAADFYDKNSLPKANSIQDIPLQDIIYGFHG